MSEFTLTVNEHHFNYVSEIKPERSNNGVVEALTPQQRYREANSSYVHRYGWGPFCRFSIPTQWTGKSGVYVLCSCNEIMYVGETQDLAVRFNQGYGTISPRNCFDGGQETNCRINTHIRDEVIAGNSVSLFYRDTENRSELESELVEHINPPWNRESSGSPQAINGSYQDTTGYQGKYLPLKQYLQTVDENHLKLSFSEIEEILGFGLPKSAHKFDAWWSNGSKPHSYAWLDSGWKVSDYSFSNQTVQFIRTQQ
ncbi:GIY-YIG nuclease family protein [Halorubrum sp. SD690R]|uniref:GIY-YIG nuclease family protein n=1 Tax=Halorubrum sp. SD690R TaxID=2518117 RepID=UPI0010F95552|nr:GIY-YIG nuclease family protein [Halorubrum sp. SD690R]TKX45570.1 GIY-YIG nuclease family protein [Halorubrum sp. SD690R]